MRTSRQGRRLVHATLIVGLLGFLPAVVAITAPGFAARAAGTAITLETDADATVSADHPRINFGGRPTVSARREPKRERAYARFELPEEPLDLVDAVLVLVSRGRSGRIDVRLAKSSWTESKITYRNAPAPRGDVGSIPPSDEGDVLRLELDPTLLSSAVVVNGRITFVLTTDRHRATLQSKEFGQKGPRLILKQGATPSPTDSPSPSDTSTPSPSSSPTESVSPTPAGPGAPIFAYYYLWWSAQHWRDKLGPNYPVDASPLPLPADLDPSGCPPTSLFEGNALTDVPPALYSQDDPTVIDGHVRLAAEAGLSGFIANWQGTGLAAQQTASSRYSERLAALVSATHAAQLRGTPFSLWLSYKASATALTTPAIINDLQYLKDTYTTDSAFDRSNGGKITLIWMGSRKYSTDVIREVSDRFRSVFYLVGDENPESWTDARAEALDGASYYWSTQDPYGNPSSFSRLIDFAAQVRSSVNPDGSPKGWFAPFTPGYDSILNGGSTCIPRREGETMQSLFEGNAASHPDAWTFISWNEITEGTYVEPLQRWGSADLDRLSALIRGNHV